MTDRTNGSEPTSSDGGKDRFSMHITTDVRQNATKLADTVGHVCHPIAPGLFAAPALASAPFHSSISCPAMPNHKLDLIPTNADQYPHVSLLTPCRFRLCRQRDGSCSSQKSL